jgi:hypothetical protein
MSLFSWSEVNGKGTVKSYEITFSANGTEDFPIEDVIGGYLMYVKYIASADDAITLTLVDADGVDYLRGQGGITDGTTGGFVTPTDRQIIDCALTPTLASLGSGSVTFTFYVDIDK